MLETLILSVVSYIGTNIDDMIINIFFFSLAKEKAEKRERDRRIAKKRERIEVHANPAPDLLKSPLISAEKKGIIKGKNCIDNTKRKTGASPFADPLKQ